MGGFQDAIHQLFENHAKIKRAVEVTDTGYKSRTVSEDPEAVKVAQNHARIVSGFVEKGPAQMHESHPRALGSEKPAAPAPGATPAACPEGKEKPKAGCPDYPPAAGKSDGPAKSAPAAKADCPKCRQAPAGEAPAAGKDAPQPH